MSYRILIVMICAGAAAPLGQAQEPAAAPTHLTIYNDDFAVARTTVPLQLHAGINEVLTTSVTSQLEPDSVVLRDPATHDPIHVLEQNYDAGVVNQAWLLEKYEGKTIDFQTQGMQVIETTTGERKTLPATTVQGRIIRAGNDPLIEVNGKMQFQLPGLPLFPVETDGFILKPTLRWQIDARKAASLAAELDYITHGMKWEATYNVIVPETADTTAAEIADVLGWVTIENHSGTEFPQATVELMAGDVAKIRDQLPRGRVFDKKVIVSAASIADALEVTQKAFDEFHLYDLHRTMTLRNGEIKQVQFIEAAGVSVQRTYEFEGNDAGQEFYPGFHNEQPGFGGHGSTHITVREEFKNSTANHLGMPLPAGRLRLYRRDTGGQVQFVGESMIPHTPAEQQVGFVTGRAFDVTARQRQTDFRVNANGHTIDESFEVKLANQKAQSVTVHAIEHMNRSQNWEVVAKSTDFTKRDSATIDFPVVVPAKGEATLTYSVHYTW
jgi:hypothetical protein